MNMINRTYRVNENRIFMAEGREFIFLPTHNAVFELAPEVKKHLENGMALEEFTTDTLFSRLPGPEEEKQEVFKELLDCRVFITSVNEHSSYSIRSGINAPLRSLVLQVTAACNLRCGYCYYGKDASSPVSLEPMTFDVAARAVDFLFDQSGPLSTVTLVFFGGEPLLQFDLLTRVGAYARKQTAARGKKIHFSLTTNGTLLNHRIIDFLNENHISTTVSMDGFKASHDRYRRFPGNRPSYDVILPKIVDLLKSSKEMPVAARVTLAKESAKVRPMLIHLLDLGFAEAGFAPATTADAHYQLSPEQMDDLLDQFADLSSKFMDQALKDDFLGFTNIIDLLVELHEGEVKPYPCGAGLGLLGVDARGGLYLCQRLLGNGDSHMGDIFSGIDAAKAESFRSAVARDRTGSCSGCWARHICAGGCYHEALIREGMLTRANSHYCDWIKKWIQTGLTVYAALSLKNPAYLDRLSHMRGYGKQTEVKQQ